jgi:hypothetical protein
LQDLNTQKVNDLPGEAASREVCGNATCCAVPPYFSKWTEWTEWTEWTVWTAPSWLSISSFFLKNIFATFFVRNAKMVDSF